MGDARFAPVCPARLARPPRPWAGLFNEHARNSIAGWSELAFTEWHTRQNVIGTIVHIPRHPDAIERVLLANAANYEKPRLVKRVLAPLVGRGLFAADGELWRTQRRIVAPSFAPGAVAGLTGLIAAAAGPSSADWPERGRIDVATEATNTTMAIIADALFSGIRGCARARRRGISRLRCWRRGRCGSPRCSACPGSSSRRSRGAASAGGAIFAAC